MTHESSSASENAKLDEEKHFVVKRNLENKLQQRDLLIYELEMELNDKQATINRLMGTLSDLKLMRAKINDDLTIEYEQISKEVEREKNAKHLLEQKCKQMSHLLTEKAENQKNLEKHNALLVEQVKFLTRSVELCNQKEVEQASITLGQLRDYEQRLKANYVNEQVVLALFSQYDKLGAHLMRLNDKLDNMQCECQEKINEMTNEAIRQQEVIRSLEAQLMQKQVV